MPKKLAAVVSVLIVLALGGFWGWRVWKNSGSAAHGTGLASEGVPTQDRPAMGGGFTKPSVSNLSHTAVQRVHPLLQGAEELVVSEGTSGLRQAVDAIVEKTVSEVAVPGDDQSSLKVLTIDYPLDGSVFPPEIVPPTFLWHEPVQKVDTWLVDVAIADQPEHLRILVPGASPPTGEIDRRCITETNEVYQPTPYQASAKAWSPSEEVWATLKRRSVGREVQVAILGFCSADTTNALSHGRTLMSISKDPVGAPIFYRDVPLAPSSNESGIIKPLSDAFLPLIAWRLRDIAKPESRLLLTDMLTCVNCHSFSADGKTLGADLDGPAGDKGAYVIAPVAVEAEIRQEHVISWNSYSGRPKDRKTIGFLSQLSPDGQYVVTTLNESVYVQNFTDYRFLQVFYPTRGILGYYSRSSAEIKALPGADDPKYVHCAPAWSPDGEYLVFARAEAKDPYPPGYQPASYSGDPAETPIQYDLYRMTFAQGQGGSAEPIVGASRNGMSNTFPKISPDGKWIVFVKCRNGQLMRPDSELWIVPVEGGTARRMKCNTSRMNSWHSFSPCGRWMVFSSKTNTPYTQMFLTHIDEDGGDSPAILVPNSTAANRAVNIPEFVNVAYDDLASIRVPATQYLTEGMRGIQLFEKGMLDEALAQFEKAVKLQPDYLEGQVSAAVILIEKGRFAEAEMRLRKALSLDPECWFAHANLGLLLDRQGMGDQAIDHFRKAIQINPKHVIARANLGRALAQQGVLDEATVQFRAAVDLAPRDAPSRVNLGNVLLQRGLFEEAIREYSQALALDSSSIDARIGLGDALTRQGKFPAAIAQFRAVNRANPADLNAANALAWLLATAPNGEDRDGPTAVRLAEDACRTTGRQDPVLLRTLAAAHAETGNWTEAVNAANTALALADPQDRLLAQEIRRHLNLYELRQAVRSTTH